MWNQEAGHVHSTTFPPPHTLFRLSLVFMDLVSTSLPFNLRYWRKIRCVVLPAHSKWTVYERISNLHKVLNQISSCPWNKYCRTSWDICWQRVRVCSKMHAWISYPAATWEWSVALCHASLNSAQPANKFYIWLRRTHMLNLCSLGRLYEV